MSRDPVRCAACRRRVAKDDIWWVSGPKGGKVVACPTCYSARQARSRESYAEWQTNQRALNHITVEAPHADR